jgi:hypothetical protein
MKKWVGIILPDGYVETKSGERHKLPFRGEDEYGYPEVLIDARSVGLHGAFKRQSVKPLIGKKCEFVISPTNFGYNFRVLPEN